MCVSVCMRERVCVCLAAILTPSVDPASSQLDPNTTSIVSLIQDY